MLLQLPEFHLIYFFGAANLLPRLLFPRILLLAGDNAASASCCCIKSKISCRFQIKLKFLPYENKICN